MHVLLDRLYFAAQAFEKVERDDANIAVFDRGGLAVVMARVEAVGS
jgi:hypothetical protein